MVRMPGAVIFSKVHEEVKDLLGRRVDRDGIPENDHGNIILDLMSNA